MVDTAKMDRTPWLITDVNDLPSLAMVMDQKNSNRRVLQPFEFEKSMDPATAQRWIFEQQTTVNWIALAYLIFIFVGPRLMKDRKPFDLRGPLVWWNWALAIFSFAGFVRMAPTFFYLVFFEKDGFYKSACTKEFGWEPEVFWVNLFTISKIFELVDTVFIVLRKAPLIFLHWYHHVSMLLFMFYCTPIADPCGRWNVVINYGIHSIMYTYYALKVSGVRIPKSISKVITVSQMLQFSACLVASAMAIYMKTTGSRPCYLHPMTMAVQLIGGISYLILFANFFIQTYFFNSKKKLAANKEKSS